MYVVDEIPVKNSRIDVTSFPHLRGIGPLPVFQRDNVRVDLLIGLDNSEALIPLEVKRGRPGEPMVYAPCLVGVSMDSLL